MPAVVPTGIVASTPPITPGPGFCGVSDMVPEVRALLEDRPLRTSLATAPTGTGGTSATAQDIVWARGDVMEFEDNGEQAMVTNDPAGTTTLGLERAINSTTAASHADGVSVFKNFRFAYDQISRAIENVISQMSAWCYSPNTQDITPVIGQALYELNGDFIELIEITQPPSDNSLTTVVQYGIGQQFPAFVKTGLPTSMSSTGKGILFQLIDNPNDIHVTYRAILTDTTVECGLVSDTVVLGTCARLVMGKAIPRVVSQDNTQGDVSVTPLARFQVSSGYQAQFMSGCAKIRADQDKRFRLAPDYRGKDR